METYEVRRYTARSDSPMGETFSHHASWKEALDMVADLSFKYAGIRTERGDNYVHLADGTTYAAVAIKETA